MNKKYVVLLLLFFIVFIIIFFSTSLRNSTEKYIQEIKSNELLDRAVEKNPIKQQLISSKILNSFTPYDGSQYDETLNRFYRKVDGKKAINTNEMKYILYWDTFYGDEAMNLGFGSDIFKRCPVKTCYGTHNHSYMPVEDFDAVIFYSGRWNSAVDGVPQKRSYKQKYIFFSWETPFNTYFDEKYVNNFYNWTLNYRRDSDIHFPYRMFFKNDTNYKLPRKFTSKKHMAMWMVSNCITNGVERRIKYVEELQKYIDVGIYGKCGTLQCETTEICRKILEDNYYYYLAFENSQCFDYVTEKTYDTLKYNVIPVVMGNANYDNIVPKHSVIDTRDFATPKLLAEYLVSLKNNFSEYIKYFEWKKYYYVDGSSEYALCQLCEMLHRPLEYTSIPDIKEWYFGFNSYLK